MLSLTDLLTSATDVVLDNGVVEVAYEYIGVTALAQQIFKTKDYPVLVSNADSVNLIATGNYALESHAFEDFANHSSIHLSLRRRLGGGYSEETC